VEPGSLLAALVVRDAEKLLETPPAERKLVGRRLLGVSRLILDRILVLATAYRLKGDLRFRDRAVAEMLAAAQFTDWNPAHFLDVAELTAAMAIGYDWLYPTFSEGEKKTFREAIRTKGLEPSFTGNPWWIKGDNNWNQVCHGGLVLGALAIAEDQPSLAKAVIDRAAANIHHAMDAYGPDGTYPEGPMYWNYGTSYNVLLLAALHAAFGSDGGLSQHTAFRTSAHYIIHATGPNGFVFNYADCSRRRSCDGTLIWFAANYGQPELALDEWRWIKPLLAAGEKPKDESPRLLPLALVWEAMLQTSSKGTAPDARLGLGFSWMGRGVQPVAFHRGAWDDPNTTYAAIKGGLGKTNHAHLDAGTFILEAGGVRWFVDLGSQDYESLESRSVKIWDSAQDGQRWTVFRLNSNSHNILQFGEENQSVQGKCEMTRHKNGPPTEARFSIVDLTPAYPGQAKSITRGLALMPDGQVLLRDEIKGITGKVPIRWSAFTHAEVTTDGKAAFLHSEGKQLRATLVEPANARFEVEDASKPVRDYDAPNPGLKRLFLRIVPAVSEAVTISVAFTASDKAPPALAKQPLREWK
jgi:hypothetical protein